MPGSEHTHTMVATLGGQPQVVTFTLDLLLNEGFPISEVIVIHPKASQPRLQRSLQRLSAEFAGDYYRAADRVIHFRSQVLQLDGEPINDISDNDHADGTLNTIHKLIGDLKRQGHRIHLSVTGGRRLMSLLAIPVASFNFDRHDHIWHIYTPDHIVEQVRDGKMMHVPLDAGVRLINGQFFSLGAYVYDPSQPFRTAQAEQRNQMDTQERARCASVVERLTDRELDVLRAFAKGLTQQEVVKELGITTKTVDRHKTKLLDICREVWAIDPNTRIGYHFLYKTFAPFFDSTEYTPRE